VAGDKPIRVMIVDDHAVVRSGLVAFLMAFEDLKMVGEASGGEEAIGMCRDVKPDVVLMDLVMPGMDGAEVTKAIKQECPEIQVIALTSFPEEDLVKGALEAGAIGYLLKNSSAEDIVAAIRAAYDGKPTLAPEATEVLIKQSTKGPPPGGNLTERELEVLKSMVEGLNNNNIAEQLFVSQSTVKFHVSNILMKLDAATRTEAVATALKEKLV
jgi:NarL family two-component system response regulator LiaR